MKNQILLPDQIFGLNNSVWLQDQKDWRQPPPINMAMELIPELELIHVGELLYVVDSEDDTKHVVDTGRFINWLITKQQPHAVNGIDKFLEMVPTWKIINLVIEFDKNK